MYVALFLCLGLGLLLSGMAPEGTPSTFRGLPLGIGFLPGAVFLGWRGRKLNSAEALLDQAGGGGPQASPEYHTVFWLRVEYWSVTFLVFGVLAVVNNMRP